MKIAYVAGPYRGKTHNEVQKNIQNAREVAEFLWSKGFAVICPHMNSAFMSGCCDEKAFLAGYIEILKRCDFVVLVDGWEASAGSTDEGDCASDEGIEAYSFEEIQAGIVKP
jgi:hypothetical protein